MLTQFRTTLTKTAILSLVLIVTLSATGVLGKSDTSQVTYSVSEIIEFGCGTTIDVVYENDKVIKIWVNSKALDDYMIEQGINEVNLTVEVIETYVKPKNSPWHYELDFIFGPSGAFFTRELEVRLEKAFVESEVWMYDEAGEELETYEHGSNGKLYFLVPHFSSYYYEGYDY